MPALDKPAGLVQAARSIAAEVAAVHAADVDVNARFPHEAIQALKNARVLGAYVPEALGGGGSSLTDLATMCRVLGQVCSSTGMVLAMHHIQVACIVRHGLNEPFWKEYLKDLCDKQRLIASVTSEVQVGGELRRSICAVYEKGRTFELEKNASTISYGEQADDLLVTCRRTADASPGDQVLVLAKKGQFTLEKRSVWNTLGMRGTCSPSFLMKATGDAAQIMSTPFGEIASETMVPFSHLLWGSVWLGIASDAVHRAHTFVREQARRTPGTVPPTATRYAELWSGLQVMRNNLQDPLAEYESILASPDAKELASRLGFALRMNSVKIATSQQVVDLVSRALLICGIRGYENDSRFSLGRHLRDSHSAALMVGNDRILATNAMLLLIHKDDL
jgi:acyl-CoA dehydrogenase